MGRRNRCDIIGGTSLLANRTDLWFLMCSCPLYLVSEASGLGLCAHTTPGAQTVFQTDHRCGDGDQVELRPAIMELCYLRRIHGACSLARRGDRHGMWDRSRKQE